MSIVESNLKMGDYINVPEFFATDVGLLEDAGGGNCRMIRCIRRRGILLPVYSLVTPTLNMIKQSAAVHEAAAKILALYHADH